MVRMIFPVRLKKKEEEKREKEIEPFDQDNFISEDCGK